MTELDKNGDRFRYPTNKNLQYFCDDGTESADVQNVYNYMMGIINFIDAIDVPIKYFPKHLKKGAKSCIIEIWKKN